MDILEKAKLTALSRYTARFLKLGIPIYNSRVPDMVQGFPQVLKTLGEALKNLMGGFCQYMAGALGA